jgi:hypothetical protein
MTEKEKVNMRTKLQGEIEDMKQQMNEKENQI